LPLKTVYGFEPVPPELDENRRHHVLGTQGQLWSEYLRDERKVEYMAFPRLCALAEVAWSPAESRDWKVFVDRLSGHLKRLDVLEVNYRPVEAEEGQVVGRWKTGEQTEAFAVRVWDITPGADPAGSATVVFQYTGGGHRLDIEWIELLVNGQVALRVNQYGITGLFNRDNRYAVTIPSVPRGGKLELRANVRGDGGGDSNGEILLVRPLR
jgi:hexosaminidase